MIDEKAACNNRQLAMIFDRTSESISRKYFSVKFNIVLLDEI